MSEGGDVSDDSLHAAAAGVCAAFEASSEAWNRGDLDGYLAGYLDSERTRWISGGTAIQGKAAIAAALKARYASPEAMGQLQITHLDIDILSDAHAMVFGQACHTLGTKVRALVFTVHLTRVGGQWLMVTDHTSAVD